MEEKEYLRNVTHTGLVDRHEHATKTKEMQVKVAKSVSHNIPGTRFFL